MVSVCTVPARGGRSCEHFGGYKTINRIPLPLKTKGTFSCEPIPASNMPGNLVAIGRAVVYFARAAHANCQELNGGTVLLVHIPIVIQHQYTFKVTMKCRKGKFLLLKQHHNALLS